MRTPFNWSTVCRACGRKFYFVDEKALLEQNLGVPIVENEKMMIETCPFCAEISALERMEMIRNEANLLQMHEGL